MGMRIATLAIACAAMPLAAQAQGSSVSAADPQGMAAAMNMAGYDAELGTDDYGDPQITTEFRGWRGTVDFYECDDTTHENCQSLRLVVGFDSAEPLPLETVNQIVNDNRFISVALDEDGDPWVTWDMMIGEGIPTSVFTRSLNRFSERVDSVGNQVLGD